MSRLCKLSSHQEAWFRNKSRSKTPLNTPQNPSTAREEMQEVPTI